MGRYRIWKYRYIVLKRSWYIDTLWYTKQRKYPISNVLYNYWLCYYIEFFMQPQTTNYKKLMLWKLVNCVKYTLWWQWLSREYCTATCVFTVKHSSLINPTWLIFKRQFLNYFNAMLLSNDYATYGSSPCDV